MGDVGAAVPSLGTGRGSRRTERQLWAADSTANSEGNGGDTARRSVFLDAPPCPFITQLLLRLERSNSALGTYLGASRDPERRQRAFPCPAAPCLMPLADVPSSTISSSEPQSLVVPYASCSRTNCRARRRSSCLHSFSSSSRCSNAATRAVTSGSTMSIRSVNSSNRKLSPDSVAFFAAAFVARPRGQRRLIGLRVFFLNDIAFLLVIYTSTRPQPITQAPFSMEKGESLRPPSAAG